MRIKRGRETICKERREDEGEDEGYEKINQKFLTTIICVVQCQINMLNLQASFMTVYHHHMSCKKRTGGRTPEETIWLLIMYFMQHAQD